MNIAKKKKNGFKNRFIKRLEELLKINEKLSEAIKNKGNKKKEPHRKPNF